MPLKTEEKTIDGMPVKVTQFAGRKNLDLLVDLAQIIGPAVGAYKGGDIMDMDVGAVVNAIMGNLNKDKVNDLVFRMLSSTFIDDRQINQDEFDRVFAGPDLLKLPKVLWFVIEVNFGNFTGLVGSVSNLQGGAASQADEAPAS